MAWEWSHDPDAYSFAEEQLHKMAHDDLVEMAAEWKQKINDVAESAWIEAQEDVFDLHDFEPPCTLDVCALSRDRICDFIWENASGTEGRNCDNGGHQLWLCPHGCGLHKVDLRGMPADWTPEE